VRFENGDRKSKRESFQENDAGVMYFLLITLDPSQLEKVNALECEAIYNTNLNWNT